MDSTRSFGADASFWRSRRVLVTGHTGFKGAWLALWLEHLGASVTGLALPPETPDGIFGLLGSWDGLDSRIIDLRDADAVIAAVADTDPDVVLHLGAQALVRRGYADPVGTYDTNVMGTAHVLRGVEAAPAVKAVVVVTSDKVYANDGAGRPFTESDPLGHGDPYSNSKACTELLVASWRASFLGPKGVPVATARAGNVVGGGDVAEDRLVPDALRALAAADVLRLRNPDAVRPWQHVLEPLAGYLLLAQRLVEGDQAVPDAVNFGPDEESCRSVSDVVQKVFELTGTGKWEHEGGEQPPEATLLRLDSSLARERLGWRPRLDLDDTLAWTVDWWRAQREGADMRAFSLAQIATFEELIGNGVG
ncbi:MAG TPA: CDP-glucose 4,6-dehydratase [Acidimicrobiales bacterium]|nr:CDP-glucose 4,6-dehydratase [Acidimicrobiales bacterium]